MAGSVFWNDKGWKKALKQCQAMRDFYVQVGIQGEKAGAKHGPGSNLTNVEIAAVHEFSGPSDTPPGRPFIRPIYDGNPGKWKAKLAKASADVLAGKNIRGELRKIGEEYRTETIDRMKAGIPPPLSEGTINRRKGQNTQGKREKLEQKGKALDVTPLIDTGTLMGSISVEVKKK